MKIASCMFRRAACSIASTASNTSTPFCSRPRFLGDFRTARDAPAHKRVVATLRNWGIEVDEVFFLGGISRSRVLEEFKPHIFFDDQLQHIEGVAGVTPSAHVPFGVANEPSPDLVLKAHAESVWIRKRKKQAGGKKKAHRSAAGRGKRKAHNR
jgi:hypothetical protein